MQAIDFSNDNYLKKVNWSKDAPKWRVAAPGLCLEGVCKNKNCPACNRKVVMPQGYKDFDLLMDTDSTTAVCPMCSHFVEPESIAFNNYWWKFTGVKRSVDKKAPPQNVESEWRFSGNNYHYFNDEGGDLVTWRLFRVKVVESKPVSSTEPS